MSNDKKTQYLKELKNSIERLHETEQVELLKLFIRNNCNYSENKNGIFINMTKLEKNVIIETEEFLEFCYKNKKFLSEDNLKRKQLI
tara:strand:- start:366 stop:626 length:261 start_codon:yes stop_codon:yes gene_type:complete